MVRPSAAEQRQRRRTWMWMGVAVAMCLMLIAVAAVAVRGISLVVTSFQPTSSCMAFLNRQPEVRLTYPGSTLSSQRATEGGQRAGEGPPISASTILVHDADPLAVDDWYRTWLSQHGWTLLPAHIEVKYSHTWTKGTSRLQEYINVAPVGTAPSATMPDLTVIVLYSIPDPENWGVCSGSK